MKNNPKILDYVRSKIRLKHYSRRTEKTYIAGIKRYILFHDKNHPKDMGKSEIEKFLTHLAAKEDVIMERGIIVLGNYVKRKYVIREHYVLAHTYLRFIVISNPKVKIMTHLQSYKAGSPYGIIYFGNITHKKMAYSTG